MPSLSALFRLVLVSAMLFSIACTRHPLKKRASAMRLAGRIPAITDDLPLDTLIEQLQEVRARLTQTASSDPLTFGPRTISREDYALGLDTLLKAAQGETPNEAVASLLKSSFDFYEVYGRDRWGEVLLTSYYEPEIEGSFTRSERFSQPLYRTPKDLVSVETSQYDDRFSFGASMRGRIVDKRKDGGRLTLVPYYTRKEIEEHHVLDHKGLEICYVNPVDGFFMEVQGSGTILLESGKRLRLGNADRNGHRYVSIGNFLLHLIPLEGMTMQAIESYLKQLPIEKAREILDRNPSYIFFQKLAGKPLTTFGTSVFPGRTIATDSRYFPKGALALLSFDKPHFDTSMSQAASGWDSVARLVMDTDTGGAIRGGGRVDLFWGSGPEAKQSAGVIKQKARLYYLVPKAEAIESWRKATTSAAKVRPSFT